MLKTVAISESSLNAMAALTRKLDMLQADKTCSYFKHICIR